MQKTVVIVDDSPFMADLLTEFFTTSLKLKVVGVGYNGLHAVSLYRQHRPDLLTMDLTMPVKDGRTAMNEILLEYPDAAILIITAQLGPPVIECLKLGAAGFVEKPLQFDSSEFVNGFIEIVERAMIRKM